MGWYREVSGCPNLIHDVRAVQRPDPGVNWLMADERQYPGESAGVGHAVAVDVFSKFGHTVSCWLFPRTGEG